MLATPDSHDPDVNRERVWPSIGQQGQLLGQQGPQQAVSCPGILLCHPPSHCLRVTEAVLDLATLQ